MGVGSGGGCGCEGRGEEEVRTCGGAVARDPCVWAWVRCRLGRTPRVGHMVGGLDGSVCVRDGISREGRRSSIALLSESSELLIRLSDVVRCEYRCHPAYV